MLKGKRKVTISTERGEIPLILDTDRALWKGEVINGKRVNTWIDPAYKAWRNMFERAYKMKDRRPSYDEVIVCGEWFTFSNFDNWYNNNFLEGCVLDKDILLPGNKVYCPEFCRFVPPHINTLLSVSKRSKRAGLLGTHTRKSDGKISARASGHRGKHLGYFNSEKEAHFAWLEDKAKSIELVAEDYKLSGNYLPEIHNALLDRAEILRGFIASGIVYNP